MSPSARSPSRATRPSLILPLVLGLAACVSPAPRLAPGKIGIVAAKETAGLSDTEAHLAVLAGAARLTVDHGYRYFILLPAANYPPARTDAMAAIHAGQAQRFQILSRAPSRGGGTQVWDAYRLLTQKSAGR